MTYKPEKTHILWQYDEEVKLNIKLNHIKQSQRDCVPCCLAMLTNEEKIKFYDIDNCNPNQWSVRLKKYGMKLAYCNYEFRQLSDYCKQLQHGTFLIGILKGDDNEVPNGTANKHLIIIQDGKIYDSFTNNSSVSLQDSIYEYNFVNRIYRVVPIDYPHEI